MKKICENPKCKKPFEDSSEKQNHRFCSLKCMDEADALKKTERDAAQKAHLAGIGAAAEETTEIVIKQINALKKGGITVESGAVSSIWITIFLEKVGKKARER